VDTKPTMMMMMMMKHPEEITVKQFKCVISCHALQCRGNEDLIRLSVACFASAVCWSRTQWAHWAVSEPVGRRYPVVVTSLGVSQRSPLIRRLQLQVWRWFCHKYTRDHWKFVFTFVDKNGQYNRLWLKNVFRFWIFLLQKFGGSHLNRNLASHHA